jgi:prepilin-type N-terminal cleavage/methylation domain-containing protein
MTNSCHHPMQPRRLRVRKARAFTLAEMVVVIGVITVLAAVAIPAIQYVYDSSREAKNRRNAQVMVSVWNAALGAGVDTTTLPIGADKIATAKNIVSYFSTPRTGAGVARDMSFHMDLDPGEIQAAASYYDWKSGTLTYTAGGDAE